MATGISMACRGDVLCSDPKCMDALIHGPHTAELTEHHERAFALVQSISRWAYSDLIKTSAYSAVGGRVGDIPADVLLPIQQAWTKLTCRQLTLCSRWSLSRSHNLYPFAIALYPVHSLSISSWTLHKRKEFKTQPLSNTCRPFLLG